MAFDPSLYTVSISPNSSSILLGTTGTVNIIVSNNNPADWGYNLTLQMTLPDGVSFDSAAFPPTSQTVNPDGTIDLVWISIKDMAPLEVGYSFPITLKSDLTFRATGLPVPFDVPLSPVTVSGTVDTKPRGDGEPGNIQYTKSDSGNVVPARYAISKSVPGKMTKGASAPLSSGFVYPHQIVVENNTSQASVVSISDILDNGIAFIGPITAAGPDAAQFLPPNPVLVVPTPGGQDYVSITWNSITLSPGSVNTITYDVAIWDNYTVGGVENIGARILHQTPLDDDVTINGASGPITATGTTSALDLMINKSQNPTVLVIGTLINYTLDYQVNQYDSVSAVVVTDVIGDGQTYQPGSAVPAPSSVSIKDPVTGETTLVWNIGALATSTLGTITFDTVVDSLYSAPPGDPVVAGDTLRNDVDITGTNDNFATPTPDSSSSTGSITTPVIQKQNLGYYYKDGTPKPAGINAAAPGDLIEFELTYTQLGNIQQKDVYVDDYLPLAMDATALSSIVYNFPPLSGPLPTGYNGVEWLVDTFIPTQIIWIVTFRAPMLNIDFVGNQNNLVKLKITDTDEMVYSDRDQIEVSFGQPNMTLTKAVAGPTPTAIQAGQTYTYTVVIGNPQNVGGTIVDAFDLDFSDIIPDYLTYVPASLTAAASAGTPSFNLPAFTPPDQIDMHVNLLKPDDEITVTYQVTVDPGIGPGLSLTNAAQTTSPYSQPFDPLETNYQYPNQDRSATQTLTSASPTMTKTVDSINKLVGDTVDYTLTWTLPIGVTAYDVVISDTMPSGQSYDNNPSPVPPASVIGQVVTWPTLTSVTGPATLVYSFRALINSALSIPPGYIETQTNNGTVDWNAAPGILPNQNTASADVDVYNPHLALLKQVRNVSRGGGFALSVDAVGNEIVEYRITVTNDGAADAYSIQIVDQPGGLSPGLIFLPSSIVAPPGTTASYNAGLNLITWDIPLLPIGNSLQLLFQVKTAVGIPPGIIPNFGRGDYTNINTISYPPEDSNPANIDFKGGVRGILLEEILKSKQAIIVKD